ncbi:MAG TPA: FADH2-dependent halogenase PltA [Cyanobacteria bacterium UBA8803]|nr:FADH2-dependent halogenase PltA [Cyanobacteria bacterium UBA9273]HBL59137.1 FADH2-dependent halogenase PltA [Cyanobacteria bacterium UBA8803]
MSRITQPDFEIGIIGGGPAGSALAAYLAKAGINCVLFEREIFPRPHVGESLVLAANRVLRELDFLPEMEAAGFPRKYGAAWTSTSGKIYTDDSNDWKKALSDYEVDVCFGDREYPEAGQPYTYHVDRGKFDLMLLQHAQKLGATVYEGIRVNRVDFPHDDYPCVIFSMGQKEVAVKVRLVVDASGRRTLLGSQLKLKIKDPVFNQFALHTWFEGYDRGKSEKNDYIFIHFLPISNSWIWQIPITDKITSFGLVTQKDNFSKQKAVREEFFWECVKKHPEVFEKLNQANRIRPFKEESDYSYAMKQVCGDGFVLIGDAARFVDPIFSSGVSVALNSARFASQDIIKAFEQSTLNNGVFKRENFQYYENLINRGTKNWYEFITLYYRLNILFTRFITDERYYLDMVKLLQGDVYEEQEPDVLQEMRKVVNTVEKNPDHVWHNLLSQLTANTFKPEAKLVSTPT